MDTEALLQRFNAVSDATRARLLHVLERHELTVSEICGVMQLPQSTVSRHLKILSGGGWVTQRAEGTSRYYRRASRLDDGMARLWQVVSEAVGRGAEAGHDEARARQAVAARRTRSQEFFATAAGRWEGVRAELFGEAPELPALLALLGRDWVVGDLGCGTGRVSATVAPYVARVEAVDESPDMLAAAREHLSDVGNVTLREGRLESLPLEDGTLDVALLSLVLHYVPDPARALAEAGRVLRPGGRVLVVDMVAHDRSEYREAMGHQWQGFERARMEEWAGEAGFGEVTYHDLTPKAEAKGPLLFALAGRKRDDAESDGR
jgi:SAM-dependent methyltransferase